MSRSRSAALIVVVIATAAVGLWMSGAVSGKVSPASPYTETFGYRGHVTQSVIVPLGASSAELRAIGGKGGGTYPKSGKEGDFVTGGDGAQVSGEIAVVPGQVLRLTVAEYGGDADHNINPGKGGWGATGTGGRGGGSSSGDGAGGGGDTRIEIADCETCKSSPILVAGGGGGAGGAGFSLAFNQGGPGGSSGATVDSGHNGRGLGAGQGGGSGASGSGHGLGGGDGSNAGGSGGGGGAGLRGGGGGGGGGTGGGGGGGGAAGSSHPWPVLQQPVVVRGGTSDGNGLIAITWNHVAAPVCPDQIVHVPHDSSGVAVRLECAAARPPTSFRIVALPDHGLLTDRDLTAGRLAYVPRPGFTGSDSMMFQALTGDAASAPATVTFEIARPVPAMSLTASSTNVPVGHPPSLTVEMPRNATGYVGFYDPDLPGADKGIGTAPIDGGVATLREPTRQLGVGVHAINASYGGDGAYAPNESNVVTVTVSPSGPPTPSATETYTYRGAATSVARVPVFTYAVEVRVIGGKGGGSYALSDYKGDFVTGGDSAQVSGRIPVSFGEELHIRVGGRGGDSNANKSPGDGGWGATGDGGRGGTSSRGDGGGGGGSSDITIGGNAIVVAGGGGGAGGTGFSSLSEGGGPGGSSGATVDPGHNGKGPGAGTGGRGGTNGGHAGGGGGNSGASLGGAGGGGGSGQAGGGGGGGGGFGGGGGGGGGAGSSHHTSRVEAPSVVRGATSDGNGVIVITWIRSVPVCVDQTVQVTRDSPGVSVRLRCNEASSPSSFRLEAYPDHGFIDHWDPIAGTFTYVPLPGYTGTDSLTFVGLHGDVASAPATVTFEIR